MTNKTEAPAFVVDGEFEDHEWREAAATPEAKRTKAQARTVAAGPRSHPYGPDAHLDTARDGTKRWFPDRRARATYVQTHEPEEEAARTDRPGAAESVSEEQARATRTGLESEQRVQGREGRGKTRG